MNNTPLTDYTGRVGLEGCSFKKGEYVYYYEKDTHPVTKKKIISLIYTGVFTPEGIDYLNSYESLNEETCYGAIIQEKYCHGLVILGFSEEWKEGFQDTIPSNYSFMPAILKNKYGAVHVPTVLIGGYSKVIGIANNCFRDCTYIKTNMPSNCKQAWNNKGDYCVYIPPYVKYIGKNAFKGCTNIQCVLVGDNFSGSQMTGGELDLGGIGTGAFSFDDEKEHILYGPFETKWNRYHSRIDKEYLDDLKLGDYL